MAQLPVSKLVMAEGARVAKLAENCAKYAPKAVLVVAVPPVSVTLPLVGEVFKLTHWYHPARLMGASVLAQIKANSVTAQYESLDPQMVHVPVVGGPDIDCAVPIFSQAKPIGLGPRDADRLLTIFKREGPHPVVTSQAFALNRLVTCLARGLCGADDAVVSAYIRSNVIGTCR